MPDPSFPSQPLYIKHYFPNIMDKIPNMDNALKIVSLLEKDIFQEYSVHQISKLLNRFTDSFVIETHQLRNLMYRVLLEYIFL